MITASALSGPRGRSPCAARTHSQSFSGVIGEDDHQIRSGSWCARAGCGSGESQVRYTPPCLRITSHVIATTPILGMPEVPVRHPAAGVAVAQRHALVVVLVRLR